MNDHRDWDREREEQRRRQPEFGRGGWPSEDRGGFGREPGYGYGRDGQDRYQPDERRRDYGYGREGSGERYGQPSTYGYGREGDEGRQGYEGRPRQPEPMYRPGPGMYRPGPGMYRPGPGVGYHEQPGQYPEHDRAGYEQHGHDRGLVDRATDQVQSWFGDDDAERRRRMDQGQSQGSGAYRGHGPRNYTRSDDRVRDDINDRLSDDPHIDASDVEVSVAQGEVTLSGTVRDRFAKRHAEDIAERVSGVKHLQNNLRVLQQPRGFSMPGQQGQGQQQGGEGAVQASTRGGESGSTGATPAGIGIPGTMTRSV